MEEDVKLSSRLGFVVGWISSVSVSALVVVVVVLATIFAANGTVQCRINRASGCSSFDGWNGWLVGLLWVIIDFQCNDGQILAECLIIHGNYLFARWEKEIFESYF